MILRSLTVSWMGRKGFHLNPFERKHFLGRRKKVGSFRVLSLKVLNWFNVRLIFANLEPFNEGVDWTNEQIARSYDVLIIRSTYTLHTHRKNSSAPWTSSIGGWFPIRESFVIDALINKKKTKRHQRKSKEIKRNRFGVINAGFWRDTGWQVGHRSKSQINEFEELNQMRNHQTLMKVQSDNWLWLRDWSGTESGQSMKVHYTAGSKLQREKTFQEPSKFDDRTGEQ